MRRVAPLILLGFVAILSTVGWTYYVRLKQQVASAPVKPKKLAAGTTSVFHGWKYSHTSSEKTVITMQADDFQELDGKDELTGVILDIFNKDGGTYNHVQCAKAEFDVTKGILYSEGEVQITMKVPENDQPKGRLMVIKSTGVSVESKTGKSWTDRPATFTFDRGDGQAVGADYDPNSRDLNLHSDVVMNWRGTDPSTIPMKIETAQVNYNERDGKVYLTPWSKLTRDTMAMNAGPATVTLQIRQSAAWWRRHRPREPISGRGATWNTAQISSTWSLTTITRFRKDYRRGSGAGGGSNGETSQTTITGDRVVMDFETTETDSLLQTAVAQGHSTMESKPVIKPGADPAETRVLKSDTIHTKMRRVARRLKRWRRTGPERSSSFPIARSSRTAG